MPFEFISLGMPGLLLAKPRIFNDGRGYFLEFYKRSDFSSAGINEYFVQDNYSRSTQGVLRGLHYQKQPHVQGKLVTCLNGQIFDVVVDIRSGSPSYSKWFGIELSGENKHILYLPPGFAHGFQVLSATAEVLYKCTSEYSPADDRGIIWSDPEIGITWPLSEPLLSDKDMRHPLLKDAENNFVFPDAQ